MLNRKIICEDEEGSSNQQTTLENVIIKTYDNSEGLYVDGTADGGSPVYIGITKSKGNQQLKNPLDEGDIIGGLQVYARTTNGNSQGYNHSETPLRGSLIFKLNDVDKNSSELLIAVTDNNCPTVRLVLDSKGNLDVSGNIGIGNLKITDEKVTAGPVATKFVKAFYNNEAYAIPLHPIQEI